MKSVVSEHQEHQLSLPRYIVGFVGCVALTLAAYLLVTRTDWSQAAIIASICALAILQFIVQMVLFLHVTEERGPRWKFMVMCLMLSVVILIVGGSVWIMHNMNNRMTPEQINQYMKSQDAL